MAKDMIGLDDLLFVIVLYKIALRDSITYKTLAQNILKEDKKVDLIVFDNSPVEIPKNVEPAQYEKFNITYIQNEHNVGVSSCYNKAAVIGEGLGKNYIVLLDQDSILPENLILTYLYSLNEYREYPIYVPKLVSNGMLYSPCNYRFFRATNLPHDIESGIHAMSNRNVLNSGIMVSLKAFKHIGGYEESVSLYFSDFVFFNKLKKKYYYFIIMDCWIKHNLSSVDYSDKIVAFNKFKLYVEGGVAASRIEKKLVSRFLYFVSLSGRSILMSVRLKSIMFVKIFIDAYVK